MRTILYSMAFVSTFAMAQMGAGAMTGAMGMPNLPPPAAMAGYGQQMGYGQMGQMGYGQMGMQPGMGYGMQQGAYGQQAGGMPYLGFGQPDPSMAMGGMSGAGMAPAAGAMLAGAQQGMTSPVMQGIGETVNSPNVLCDGIINGSYGPNMGPLTPNATPSSAGGTSGRHTN